MPTFQYQATNAAGQEVTAQIDAAAPEEAAAKIRTLGYFPTKIVAQAERRRKAGVAGAKPGKKGLSISFGGVSITVLTTLTRQLSTLQDAGLPILRSLKILASQERPGLLKNTLNSLADDVEGGATLSEAMGRHPKVFNRLYVNMVQAGEAGGVLDVILQRLAEFMEKAQRLRRRVIGAMIYPAVVVSFAVLIVTGIMIVVVPKFRDIFRDFHTTLPKITEYLLAVSNWVARDFGWAVILGSPFVAFLAAKFIRKTVGGRRVLDLMKIRLPILGKILRKTAIARFTRTLGTLLAAGVPILDSIGITRDTIGNVIFEGALQKVHDAIREGEGFAGTLKNTRVCDQIVTNMIDVGEETGDLDKMLMKIADNYDEEVDVLVGSLVSLLEPVMVISLGLVVGTIVVALFMPLVTILTKLTDPGSHD